ncbi:hypothetical protein GC177_01945 [bacterium]|nr:hypothetical protein [bacterium]
MMGQFVQPKALTSMLLWLLRSGLADGRSKLATHDVTTKNTEGLWPIHRVFAAQEPSMFRLIYFKTLFPYMGKQIIPMLKEWVSEGYDAFWDEPLSESEYAELFRQGNSLSTTFQRREYPDNDIRPLIRIARQMEAMCANGAPTTQLATLRISFWNYLAEGNHAALLFGFFRREELDKLSTDNPMIDLAFYPDMDMGWVQPLNDFQRRFDRMVEMAAHCQLLPEGELPPDWPQDGAFPYPTRRGIAEHVAFLHDREVFNAIYGPGVGAASFALPLLEWLEDIATSLGTCLPEVEIGDVGRFSTHAQDGKLYYQWPVYHAILRALSCNAGDKYSQERADIRATIGAIHAASSPVEQPLTGEEVGLLLGEVFFIMSLHRHYTLGCDPLRTEPCTIDTPHGNTWGEAFGNLMGMLKYTDDPAQVLHAQAAFIDEFVKLAIKAIHTTPIDTELLAPLRLIEASCPGTIPVLEEEWVQTLCDMEVARAGMATGHAA